MAIGKFFKNFFSVEIEEEVEPEFARQESSADNLQPQQKSTQSNSVKPVEKKVQNPGSSVQSKTRPVQLTREEDKNTNTKKPLMPFSLKPKDITSKVSDIRKQEQSEEAPKTAVKEYNTMSNLKGDTKVHLVEPRVYTESQDIADELKRSKATLVNLTRVDQATKKRIIDFLSGTVYALDGDIQRVGQDIFLCTPNDFGVSGEISDQYEQYEE